MTLSLAQLDTAKVEALILQDLNYPMARPELVLTLQTFGKHGSIGTIMLATAMAIPKLTKFPI